MIEEIRQFTCGHCQFSKRLKKEETVDWCPACGNAQGLNAFKNTVKGVRWNNDLVSYNTTGGQSCSR